MSREATERRLRATGFARLEPGEEIVVWCRAWVSRAGHLQRLAPRWRDVAVVTDRRLLLFGVGTFTRRPRRRVLADRLDLLTVEDVGAHPGRGRRCTQPGRPPTLLELGGDAWSRKLGQELQERVAAAAAASEPVPVGAWETADAVAATADDPPTNDPPPAASASSEPAPS